jgi:hypothetical protein
VSVQLDVPGVPKSFNETAYKHWRTRAREKKKLEGQIAQVLMVHHAALNSVMRATHVRASAKLRFAVRRARRDEGNFRAPLEKALGDALVSRGIIPDDTAEHFTFGTVRFDPETGPARTLIELEITKGESDG